MVHLKIVLDTRRKKSDGTYPITYRVTLIKKVHLIQAGFSIKEEDWDIRNSNVRNSHPNYGLINLALSKRFYEIQKVILRLEEDNEFSFDCLKAKLSSDKPKQAEKVTFLSFSTKIINQFMSVNRTGNALVYQTAVNRLIKYTNNPNIEFKSINYELLEDFRVALIKDGLKENSISNYFRSIRALYNKAIKFKIVSRDLYPFDGIKIIAEKTAKRAISIEEVNKLYGYPKVVGSQEWHSSNYFFLSLFLRGMSFTDMAYLKKEDIHNGYITYKRRKTKKHYCIKAHPAIIGIFNYYKSEDSDYLLPIFRLKTVEDSINAKKTTRQWIKTTNKYLNRIASNCGIGSNITTYVTRHTFATVAKKKLGYANEVIAECLGHEYGNKITNTYLDSYDQSLIDEVNERVISLINC
jgi:integrase/recombinase XerD